MDLFTLVFNTAGTLVTPFFNFIYYNIFNAPTDEAGTAAGFLYIISGIVALIFYIIAIYVNFLFLKKKKITILFIFTNTLLVIYVLMIIFPLLGCGTIFNSNYRNECKNHVYEAQARKSGDYVICEKTSGGGHNCYYDIAITLNEARCDSVTETLHRDNCYNVLVQYGSKKSSEICRKITTEELRDTCLLSVARDTHNATLCEEIGTIRHKNSCYAYSAQSKKYLEKCYETTNTYSKNTCITNIALAEKEAFICNRISNDDLNSNKDDCFERVATDTGNYSACLSIEDTNKEAQCLRYIALSTNNPSVCTIIKEEDWRDDCYLLTIEQKEHKYLCAKIADEYQKSNCYYNLVTGSEDLETCKNIITAPYFKNACFYKIGVETKNYNVCDNIDDSKSTYKTYTVQKCKNEIQVNS